MFEKKRIDSIDKEAVDLAKEANIPFGTARRHLIADELFKYGIDIRDVAKNSTPPGQDYDENLRKHIPDNFCVYPFVHFQLDPDGRSRPCCKYGVGQSWELNVPRIPEKNIEELWEQPEIQQLRESFLRNERPQSCKACWDEEAAGITSMRLSRENGGKQYPHSTLHKHIWKKYPETLDLKLSNLCNLKCRICTPFLSTQWMKETKDLNITDTGTQEMFLKNAKEKFIENKENIDVLKKWAPTITGLEFYGGEPLMQQEHDTILNIVELYGVPELVGVHYNTNGTICEERFFLQWKKFKEINVRFSIDDLYERYEYQRKNAKWNEVNDNIRKFTELAKKHKVNLKASIYITVGILNVLYLNEIIEHFKSFDVEIIFNNVHYPTHYSIFNLPSAIKSIVKEKLLSIDMSSVKLSSWSPTIDQLINFLYVHEPDLLEFEKFITKTKLHDNYRNESFEEVFPELQSLIKSHYVK